jgi:histidine decarboxylase
MDATPTSPLSLADTKLDRLFAHLQDRRDHFAGYPCTANFDYSALFRFLNLPVNNIGDPYVPTLYGVNTHEIEREVLEWFRKIARADDNDSIWGYVTNGGTEGNMYGCFLARELFPDGILYFSEDTHYSVVKILRVLNIRNIMIKSQPNGEMDYDDLRETLRIHRDVPPIIFANIGTTMKGAVDDLGKIRGILKDLAITRQYIHADGALSGMILPFVDDPQPFGFDHGIDSFSVSGHKMVGSPIPCGIVLARKENVARIARSVEYVGTLDTTLPGSRNGITPLFLWYTLQQYGVEGFRARIRQCLDLADYTVGKLQAIGLDAWLNRNSITVVLPRPSDRIVSQWQLAVQGDIAHIITMPHLTTEVIDRLVEEIRQDLPASKGVG